MARSLLLTSLLVVAVSGTAVRGEDVPPAGASGRGAAWADSVGRAVPADSGRVVPTVGVGKTDATRAASKRADDRPWHRRPRYVMLRSVAVPGWGQWANGRHVKSAVVAAGEGYLIWRAVDYGRQEREKGREARLASADPVRYPKLLERKRYYGSRRRDFTWWSIFAAALSMGDAYVDAQLGAFDPEFTPQDGSGGSGLDRTAGFRFGLKLRLP